MRSDKTGNSEEAKREGPAWLNQCFVRSTYENSKRGPEASLYEFLWRSWHVLEPETEFKENWHIKLVCEYLEAVSAGQIPRLILNEPPRHTKSFCASICWPVWVWLKEPSHRFMFVSYDAALATEHSLKRRDLILSRFFQDRWASRFRLKGDMNVKTHFENDRQGSMLAAPLRGGLTGHGADTLVIDDPHDRNDQENDETIKADVETYRKAAPQCLNDPETSRIVVIAQQLNENDLTNWLLKNQGDRWTHVCLEAEAQVRKVYVFPISKGEYIRDAQWEQITVGNQTFNIGEPLQPDRWGRMALAEKRIELGKRRYDAQYLQRPSSLEGGIMKRAWWRFYRLSWCPDPRGIMPTLPDAFDMEAQSWDMAFKDYTDNSFVEGQHWGTKGANRYLLDETHAHLDFPKTCQRVSEWDREKPQAHAKWIEDKANGPAVIATLRDAIGGLLPIDPKELGGSKVARLSAASVDIEAGNVYLPDPDMPGFSWVHDFIDEVCKCQSEKSGRWDRADAASQAIIKMRRSAAFGLIDYFASGQAQKDLDKIQAATPLARPMVPDQAPVCPECQSKTVIPVGGGQLHCNQCGIQWWPTGSKPAAPVFSRRDLLGW